MEAHRISFECSFGGMMRRWFWLLISILLVAVVPQVSAQKQSQDVFYGLDLHNNNTFISYTLDGTKTNLLENVESQDLNLLATDSPDNPLLVAYVNDKTRIYLVGPSQAPQAIKLPD